MKGLREPFSDGSPACGEDTFPPNASATELSVHPRARGGHEIGIAPAVREYGSPARAGRTLLVERADFFFARFTPARGEDTATSCLPSWYVPVYPRAGRTPGAAKSA